MPKLAEGKWTLVVKNKKKKKHKNKKCVRVQSHNGRVSEVSCENGTHTAIAAQKIGDIEKDIGWIGLHHESWWYCNGIAMGLPCDCNGIESWWDYNEKQLWWDYKGIYEDENTIVI